MVKKNVGRKFFLGQKKCRSEIFGGKKNWVRNFFGSKKLGGEFFGLEIVLDPKIWVKKFLDKIFLGLTRFVCIVLLTTPV